MTMTRAQLKKSLKASLKREGKIKVSDTYPREDLQGKVLTIASKTTTVCNGHGRCASEAHCIGLSVFATDPQVPKAKPKKDKKIGWRHGTVKICLTHLKTTKGEALIPLDVAPPARRRPQNGNQRPIGPIIPTPVSGNGGSSVQGVTWQELAVAHEAKDLDKVTRYARLLKSEHEQMALRLVNAQAKLLERQEASSDIRDLQGVRSG